MSISLLNRSRIRAEFAALLDVGDLSSRISQLCIETNSESPSELYGFTGAVPKPAKRLGPQGFARLVGRRIQVDNVRWQSGVEIDIDDYRRDQTGSVRAKLGELAESFGVFKWEQIVDIMNNGNSSSYLAYDGQNFYSASHSLGDSGTLSNLLTTSDLPVALNVADTADITPEEMVIAIMGVIGKFQGFKDDKGRAMNRTARKFLVTVPTAMWYPAATAMSANNLQSGKTNQLLAIRQGGYEIDVVAEPELTSSTSFFVHRLDGMSRKPFICQTEVPVELTTLDENSEYSALNDAVAMKGAWVGGFAPGEPLYSIRATVS